MSVCCSADGYLFDKEAILEYYLAKKREILRQQKEYEKQNKREENEINELKAAAHRSQVEKFIGIFNNNFLCNIIMIIDYLQQLRKVKACLAVHLLLAVPVFQIWQEPRLRIYLVFGSQL
jgi:hypothetical protein